MLAERIATLQARYVDATPGRIATRLGVDAVEVREVMKSEQYADHLETQTRKVIAHALSSLQSLDLPYQKTLRRLHSLEGEELLRECRAICWQLPVAGRWPE